MQLFLKKHRQITLILLLIIGNYSCTYLPDSATSEQNLIIEENADYILLKSSLIDNNKAAIIFYPGGLVDPHAYITSLKDLVLVDNRMVVILKFSANLAIWNSHKAKAIINEITTVKKWVIGGHCLGGSTACITVFNNPGDFEGLFLLAAYSVNDLADAEFPVISITASEDNILDKQKFNENRFNLPEGVNINTPEELPIGSTSGKTLYYEIEGGNHGQFGNYGTQKGDGIADLDPDVQQQLVIAMLRKFLMSNNL